MTIAEAVKILNTEYLGDSENMELAKQMGASALMTLEQYRWEYEIATSQFEQLGIGFAEKIDGVYISRDKINNIIQDILGEMYIDEQGNNVLNGDTNEYETKWKYKIGCNYGLQKAINILKSHTD